MKLCLRKLSVSYLFSINLTGSDLRRISAGVSGTTQLVCIQSQSVVYFCVSGGTLPGNVVMTHRLSADPSPRICFISTDFSVCTDLSAAQRDAGWGAGTSAWFLKLFEFYFGDLVVWVCLQTKLSSLPNMLSCTMCLCPGNLASALTWSSDLHSLLS